MTSLTDDTAMIVWLSGAAGCSLNESPKKNWVENDGGLPNYICVIAKGVMKSGKSRSSAIAIAVSRVKKWAAGGDKVDADTRAKSAKAVAEWEALKSKAHAKKVVKASVPGTDDEYLMLTNVGSFNTDIVRGAYNKVQQAARQQARQSAIDAGVNYYGSDYEMSVPYTYIKELWTDHIIVNKSTDGYEGAELLKVPYTVSGSDVTFGDAIEVEQQYVEVTNDDDDDSDSDSALTDNEAALLGDILNLTAGSPADKIAAMAKRLGVTN